MRYLKNYDELFEKKKPVVESDEETEEKLGSLLYLYSGFPIDRSSASKVLRRNLKAYGIKFNLFDKNLSVIDFSNFKGDEAKRLGKHSIPIHTKLRFNYYFTTLTNNENNRTLGINFEGTISAFFNGKLAPKGNEPYDVEIDDKKISVKMNNKPTSIVVGQFKSVLTKDIINNIEEQNDIHNLNYYIKSLNIEEQKKFLNSIFEKNIDYFLISYFNIEQNTITCNLLTKDNMIDFLTKDNCKYLSMGKSGKSSKYEIRTYTINDNSFNGTLSKKFDFKFKELTLDELNLYYSKESLERTKKIFDIDGDTISTKMRFDVMSHILDNREEIINNLKKDIEDNPPETINH